MDEYDLSERFEGVDLVDTLLGIETIERSILDDSSLYLRDMSESLCAVRIFKKKIISLIEESIEHEGFFKGSGD